MAPKKTPDPSEVPTEYTDPATVDVPMVMANVEAEFQKRGDEWTDQAVWPNITVKALADRIRELEHNAHLVREDCTLAQDLYEKLVGALRVQVDSADEEDLRPFIEGMLAVL